MYFYTFHFDGFNKASAEFYADQGGAECAALETALEVSRDVGHLVFVTVRDSEGEIVCAAPRLSREAGL